LVLVAAGILLLLNNYLLISLNVLDFWPVVLIFLGLQLLWRGDLALSWQAQTFGITRGSVQQGALEISSGEIDVRLKALTRPGRLVAGQYTARSRPALNVRNNRASLVMRRGNTWLFSLADWDVGLAADLPWALLVSAHLGQLEVDLRGLEISRAHLASGFGDVRVVCPDRVGGLLFARSTFGDVRLAVPEQVPALIRIQAGLFCRIIRHSRQFHEQADRTIVTPTYEPSAPAIEITLSSTFGNVHLLSAPARPVVHHEDD
jgi:hypothetical protein